MPNIINVPADFWTDRNGQAVVAIIAHGTGGGLKSSLTSLQHGDGRGVSVHVLIAKNGDIYRLVSDERGANHAGAASSTFTLHGKTYTAAGVNRATYSFELENMQDGRDPYPDVQLFSMGWQIDQWRAKDGALPILRHEDLDPTRRRDPVKLTVNDMELWAAKARQTPVQAVRRFTVTAPMFWLEDRRPDAPIANQGRALLQVGDEVAVDDVTNGWAHAQNGIGFTLMAGLVKA